MSHRRQELVRIIRVWCMLLCFIPAVCLGDTEIEMTADEWTWNANEVASFHGSIVTDQDAADAVLTLRAETSLEDSGEVIFTSVNGKKLKIRKRGPEITEDLQAGSEFLFEGEWNLPADTGGGIARAVITLTIQDAEGNTIAEGRMEEGSLAAEEAIQGASPAKKADQLILILLLAGLLVWLAAVSRYLVLNLRRGREGATNADL